MHHTLGAVPQRDEFFVGQRWCRQALCHPANMRLRRPGSSQLCCHNQTDPLPATEKVQSPGLRESLVWVWLAGSGGAGRSLASRGRPTLIPSAAVWDGPFESFVYVEIIGAGPRTPKVGYVRNPSGPSKKVRTAMGRQICAPGPSEKART
jgi:hypothetical protein